MTKEEAKVQRAIEAARIAKQTLLEENRDRMPLEVEEDLVKVTRPKAENVTIKIPNQDKEGYGLAGVENEYKIKKSDEQEELNDKYYRLLMQMIDESLDKLRDVSRGLRYNELETLYRDIDNIIQNYS